eukprot:1194565-Prorocentrum_minimum.AAC.2
MGTLHGSGGSDEEHVVNVGGDDDVRVFTMQTAEDLVQREGKVEAAQRVALLGALPTRPW